MNINYKILVCFKNRNAFPRKQEQLIINGIIN